MKKLNDSIFSFRNCFLKEFKFEIYTFWINFGLLSLHNMEVAIPLVFLLENSFSGENNRIDFEIRFNIKTPGRVKFVARLKK